MRAASLITLILPPEQKKLLIATLHKAGRCEVGGILMGENAGPNLFIVREITVHPRGAFASFVRRIDDAIGGIHAFFQKTNNDYERFNYIGEWHSHPSFEPYPSRRDDLSMLQIVQDKSVGANFVVLLIIKLGYEEELVSTAHTYLPNGTRAASIVKAER